MRCHCGREHPPSELVKDVGGGGMGARCPACGCWNTLFDYRMPGTGCTAPPRVEG